MRLELFADRDQLFLGESAGTARPARRRKSAEARFGGGPHHAAGQARSALPHGAAAGHAALRQDLSRASRCPSPPTSPGSTQIVAAAKIKDQTVTSEPFSFFVKPYSPETVPRPARVDILQALSQTSGGQFYENVDALNKGLSSLKLQATEEKSAEYRSLWRDWPMVAGLMLMLGGSWSMRKLRNMP